MKQKREYIVPALSALILVAALITVPVLTDAQEENGPARLQAPQSSMMDQVRAVMAGYEDLQNHWARDASIRWMQEGVFQGDGAGQFHPGGLVTRAELASVFARVMNYKDSAPAGTFADVKRSAWYYDEVMKAAAAGAITGSDGFFFPDRAVTREEAAVMFVRAFHLEQVAKTKNPFADQSVISAWALPAVNAMKTKGYIQGTENRFYPGGGMTRAEAAVILHNIIDTFYSTSGVKGGETVENTVGNILVNISGITLLNRQIGGDVFLAEGIGAGRVKLSGVTLKGNLQVGGGETVSLVERSRAEQIRINRPDHVVKLVLEGHSSVRLLQLESGARITSEKNTVISETMVKSPAVFQGEGAIKKAHIHKAASGTSFEKWPQEIWMEAGAVVAVAGEHITNAAAETIQVKRPAGD